MMHINSRPIKYLNYKVIKSSLSAIFKPKFQTTAFASRTTKEKP